MPTARIITRNPVSAAVTARNLRDAGYRVHVVSPEHTNLSHADLEIDLDREVFGSGEAYGDSPEREFVLAPLFRRLSGSLSQWWKTVAPEKNSSEREGSRALSSLPSSGISPFISPIAEHAMAQLAIPHSEPTASRVDARASSSIPQYKAAPIAEEAIGDEAMARTLAPITFESGDASGEIATSEFAEPVKAPPSNPERDCSFAEPDAQFYFAHHAIAAESDEGVNDGMENIPGFARLSERSQLPIAEPTPEPLFGPQALPEAQSPPGTQSDAYDLTSEPEPEQVLSAEPIPAVDLAPAAPAAAALTEPTSRYKASLENTPPVIPAETPVIVAAAMKIEAARRKAAHRWREWRADRPSTGTLPTRDYFWQQAIPIACGLALMFLLGWAMALRANHAKVGPVGYSSSDARPNGSAPPPIVMESAARASTAQASGRASDQPHPLTTPPTGSASAKHSAARLHVRRHRLSSHGDGVDDGVDEVVVRHFDNQPRVVKTSGGIKRYSDD